MVDGEEEPRKKSCERISLSLIFSTLYLEIAWWYGDLDKIGALIRCQTLRPTFNRQKSESYDRTDGCWMQQFDTSVGGNGLHVWSLASVWLLENDRSIMVFFPSGIGISSYWSLLMEIGVQFPLSWVDSAWYEVIGVNLLNYSFNLYIRIYLVATS